jgi:putative ABC transport system permease protein
LLIYCITVGNKKNKMIKHYFQTAWRNLKLNKVYAAINIGGIAIGLAAFWLIALYVADELSYDTSFTNADRICRIVQHATWPGGNMNIVPTSAPFATAFKNDFPQVEDAARIDIEGGGIIHYDEKTIRQDDICFSENSFFKIFDYHFLYGDPNTALSQPQSIVITESLAHKIFGDASKAINKTIFFGSDHYPNKVTGVIKDMPQNSHLQFSGIRSAGDEFKNTEWQNAYLYTYLLLKKGTDIKSFEKKLAPLEKDISNVTHYTSFQIQLQPLTSIHLHSDLDYELSNNGSISRVYMFVVIGLLVLLIALINYMNLSTARAAIRVKEIGIRKVIGSGKKHLIALFISESLLITFIAAAIGFFLVSLSLPYFNDLAGKSLSLWRFGKITTMGAILIFTVLTGMLSGSYPALFLSRFKMIPSLKGQLGNLSASIFFRKSLVVFQFIIAVFLISSSYVIYSQMKFVSNKDLGFNKEQVLSFHIDEMKVRNEVPALKHALLQSRLIEGVAIAGNPIGNNDLGENGFFFEKNGEMEPTAQSANKLYIDEDFLQTSGIHLLQGRNFSEDMPTDKDDAVIINETLMKKLGYANAIGKKMQYNITNDSISKRVIVGVVKDFNSYSLQHKIEPMVMLLPPNNKEKDNLYVKIAKGKAAAGIAFLKNAYSKFDPNNTADFHFLDENFNRQYSAERKEQKLSLAFTILAFIIACLGLLGLVIFMTAQRRKEIGVRKVLGATVMSITLLVSKDFGKLVFISTIIAIPVAWFVMNKWLENFAYRIDIKWWMFLLSGGVAIIIALITVSFQAIKAAIANPVKSLRTE